MRKSSQVHHRIHPIGMTMPINILSQIANRKYLNCLSQRHWSPGRCADAIAFANQTWHKIASEKAGRASNKNTLNQCPPPSNRSYRIIIVTLNQYTNSC
jgi:hypothetical protein